MRAISLVLVTGCSFAFPEPARTPTMASMPPCGNAKPVADTAISAGLVGASVGSLVFIDGAAPAIVTASALAVASTAYFISARKGFRDTETCHRIELARALIPEPLPVLTVGLTCEQRRLDMYSRAVTGANATQRERLLRTLPSCNESITRERAWVLTRMASLDAGAGKCDDIETVAREIHDLDVVLHDVVFLGDIEVKFCLQQQRREL